MRSIVAGIIDRDGNLNRMVVTHPGSLRFHVHPGESYVTLRSRVKEPVSDNEAYGLIQRLEELIKARKTRRVL